MAFFFPPKVQNLSYTHANWIPTENTLINQSVRAIVLNTNFKEQARSCHVRARETQWCTNLNHSLGIYFTPCSKVHIADGAGSYNVALRWLIPSSTHPPPPARWPREGLTEVQQDPRSQSQIHLHKSHNHKKRYCRIKRFFWSRKKSPFRRPPKHPDGSQLPACTCEFTHSTSIPNPMLRGGGGVTNMPRLLQQLPEKERVGALS